MLILLSNKKETYRGIQSISSSLGISGMEILPLAILVGNLQYILLSILKHISGIESIRISLVENEARYIQVLNNSLKDPATGKQYLLNCLSSMKKDLISIMQTISGEAIRSNMTISNELSEKDIVNSLQSILNMIGDETPSVIVQNWDIYLDGISIKHEVTEIDITYSDGSIHNQIEISSNDRTLFEKSDPNILYGQSRIEIHVETRILLFLLEEKRGDQTNFSLWGRSKSAIDDYPYSATTIISLSAISSAKTVAENELLSPVDWEIPNWTLPVGYEFEGSSIELLQNIAAIAGAIVRCKDDGSLQVRRKYPIRPINMQAEKADVDYDRIENIIALSYEDDKGKGYDSVNVYGYTSEIHEPDLVIESKSDNSQYAQGDEVFVKVYWPYQRADNLEIYLTAGKSQFLGTFFETIGKDSELYVNFENNVAQLSSTIETLLYYEWIGAQGGSIDFTKGTKELTNDGIDYAIAKIIYTTKYDRYSIIDHDVPILMKVLKQSVQSGVAVKVLFNNESNNQAEDIIDKNLTNNNIAFYRGQSFIDQERYDISRYNLRVPYNDNAIDGNLAYINDPEIGISGNCYIESVKTTFSGPQIINSIGVLKCKV